MLDRYVHCDYHQQYFYTLQQLTIHSRDTNSGSLHNCCYRVLGNFTVPLSVFPLLVLCYRYLVALVL